MQENIINVRQLDKVYKIYKHPMDRVKEAMSITKKLYSKNHYALQDINIEIYKGQSVGILGTNGSGKSTLLKIITGVLNPTSGSVEVKGKVSALLELGAGFNPEYTGVENVYLNGSMMGYTKKEMESKLDAIINFADIGDFVYQPVKTYSSGMFARLAFAVAINVEPDILIVDEALSVGDARFQTKCIEKMEQIKKKGTTILFVTHATEQVRRFCDRAIWIDKGHLKMDGESTEIVDLYESWLVYGDKVFNKNENLVVDEIENPDKMGRISNVELSAQNIKTFDCFYVDVTYEIYEAQIPEFLLGVAIYTPNREYVFGPNTYLEKVEVPKVKGVHKVRYRIPEMPLLPGVYNIDVGIFAQRSIVCIDYKTDILTFVVHNDYTAEGRFYIKHEWEVLN
ncbi:MAG TPA: ABC transporter ATP-binding protein [Firmicutes bacterium]|nr:ABC transporter ATP-binding protein [Bacillota bacterium]